MRNALILIAMAGAALAGCGAEDGGDPKPKVVATTGVIAAIVEEVAGDDTDVVQLIPDSASPHDFALSAKDRLELEDADLVAVNGAGLEAGLPLDEVDAPIWELTEHAGPLLTGGGDHEHGEGGEGTQHGDEHQEEESEHDGEHSDHEEGGGDPHVWMDPTRIAGSLPSLAAALGNADAEHASAYRERGRHYAERLRELDRELATVLEAVPADSRLLVTNHDALGYFAHRYDFEVVATVFPASGPEAQASAKDLAELEAIVRETGVPAVFAEEGEDPVTLRRVAGEVEVEMVADLLVESPGEAGSYEEMLRRDAKLIAGALAPG